MYNYDLTHSEILNIFLLGLPNLTHTEILELYGVTVTDADLINMRIQIKIHENFTISDGTSSSAFTTGDADYTPITFANKLSTALTDNTVTFGATGGSGYLEFANSATLTGMPNYIFAITESTFSVKAGGRVHLRNVNLDAEMAISLNYVENTLFKNEFFYSMNTSRIADANTDHYTNILSDNTFYNEISSVGINSDGSVIALGNKYGDSNGLSNNGAIGVYKRDTNEPSGWIKIGGDIVGYAGNEEYGITVTLSHDGQIVSGTGQRYNGGINGFFMAWKQDPTNTSVGPIGWTMHGNLLAGISSHKWRFHHMSGDGNALIWWAENTNSIKTYKHNSGTNVWDEISNTFQASGGNANNFNARFSYDGMTLLIGDISYETDKGLVQLYARNNSDQFNKIGNDLVGTTGSKMGTNLAINKNGDIFAFSNTTDNSIKIYKNNASVFSNIGEISIRGIVTHFNLSLDDIGHTLTASSKNHADDISSHWGSIYIYKYNTTSLTWDHIITNNVISNSYNTYSVGGTDPIFGSSTSQLGMYSQVSGDGSALIASGGDLLHLYNLPSQRTINVTSTLPAGDSFINNFVSKISTDINTSLSYDAYNKNITFDDIAEKTLPFITYGQAEPNYIQDGLLFLSTIKIHTAFTIDDGTSTSAFTIADTDYTQITFANKLSADLAGNTVTFGSTGDSGYLEFANSATLTGMPNYIFVIPFSDFSVKSGGRVKFRNVNLDADMTIATASNTSTIPAGNYFINNFVSTIENDLVNYTLSYDASNANITFDGISENIEISITSTDTTVFDTSITEITVAENTLSFITYGQPEPSYFQYSLNGITYDEFIANGISATELKSLSVIPGWSTETDANQFDKSYVLGFMDVSGYMAIRNDCDMVVMGNTTIDGTINMQEDKTLSSSILSVDSRLFANGDISANGKLYVGSDLSVNGQFSSNFAGNSIPYSKIKDSPIITGNVKIGEDVSFNGPTIEFGSGATLKISGTTEFNDNTVFDVNSIRFSGTIVGGNMVFKDTTITDVVVNGSATATTVTSSDYRIKSNVTELNETHTVDKLEPIYYENTLTGNHEYGLIAHELQAEYPDLVINEKDGDEYQSVHYDGLIGVLVKEIQDLKKRLNVLNNT
jgi:hypothetical protein